MASSSGNSDSQHSLSCCRLHQEYTLLHLLGEGSYAKVLLCQKNEDDEMFAVKIIPLDDTREGKERREVKAHRTLSGHPNIVRFYQSWEGTRETTCIEDDLDDSEYTAESASDSLIVTTVQDGPADPINILVHSISKRKAWKYFKELITALQYIHSQGFIHRDITTGNLFLSSEGRLVVGDFGFAIEVEYADDFYHGYNTRLCSAKVGTALYAAPEVMSPEPQEVGCLADIYSAGIVLIDLLDPFTLSMERSCVLQGINDGYFPDTLLPLEASYIKRLVSMDAMNRPSAQTLLDQFDEDTAGIRATYPVEAMDEDTSDDSD